jgi:hypothetical protein
MNIEVKEIRAYKFADSLFVARHECAGESGGTILRTLGLCNELGAWSTLRFSSLPP